MLKTAAIFVFSVSVPTTILAQQVELKSSDEFISVEGEIVGFNGVMVSIETSVGLVNVPASEVICFGDGCVEIIQSNDFGLTAAAFDDVVSNAELVVQTAADDFMISFDAPALSVLYSNTASAFAVAADTSTRVELASSGLISLENDATGEVATIARAVAGGPSDIRLGTVSMHGPGNLAFAAQAGWSNTTQLRNQLLALDAFAVVAAPNVGVETVTLEDLARIYAGELTNWSELGGPDLGILPLQLPENSPKRNEITKLIMEPFGKSISTDVLVMADESGLALSVNQFPGSVSIISVREASENATLDVAGACGVGVAPTPFSIVSGDYPLNRPLMVSYDRLPNTSLLTEMFDFAVTPVAQDLFADSGFIDLSGVVQDNTDKNARLGNLLNAELDGPERAVAADMFQALFEAERLSPTIFGGATSGPEGAWNRAMIRSLADMLRDPEYAGKQVMFVGFAESDNGGQAEVDASALAASELQTVFSQSAANVIRANGLSLASFGFGGIAKATCIDSQIDGQISTRVEVWVR